MTVDEAVKRLPERQQNQIRRIKLKDRMFTLVLQSVSKTAV